LHKDYEDFFDWKLDETLFVGLISSHNQIANGFSTQWPNNRQINYVGGTQMIDYFSSTSWLDTLLYHETAHNYQLNVKGSVISEYLHSVFGNGALLSFMMPLTVPNTTENSFLLEGNAVLNESWHGNGGRLYSGRFKAETILQAKAGNITSGDVYNSKLAFPYGDIVYIQGAFYNLYMAEKYGIKNLNSYFKYHSQDLFFPQFTNASMKQATGIDFEESLIDFSKEYASMPLAEVKGKKIASSQFFYSLGNDLDEIFFITNEKGVNKPELVVVDKKTSNIKKVKDSWLCGKVLKVEDEYYTQGSKNISPSRVYQGLFCNQAFIKKGTESKMVQGYLRDSTMVYFDVPSSYSEAQLYVGDKFYAKVNSSVIIDKEDNLYYFIQYGKTRVLYKNKKPLYAYKGFYGIVSDVDSKGSVYFIANSEFGSTLYRYKKNSVSRASMADNIVESRLINDNELLLACVGDKDYYYVKNNIQTIEQTPYETKLYFENKEYYANSYKQTTNKQIEITLDDSYNALTDMHYSGSDIMIGTAIDGSWLGTLNINFSDPLSQNSSNFYLSKDDSSISIAGLSYSNSQYLLKYSINAYGVIDNNEREDVRESGVMLNAILPFLQTGYYYGDISTSYFQDYDTKNREPLTLSVNFSKAEIYGNSMYMNHLNALQLYGVSEREDKIFGGSYMFRHHLSNEYYFSLGAKYSQASTNISPYEALDDARGVKFTNIANQEDMDPSTITMPSLYTSFYMKKAAYAEISIAKVLNYAKYYFTFPVSLQRESIYAKYRFYQIEFNKYEDFLNTKHDFNEVTIGLTLSSVFLNSFILPINLEYIYNDGEHLIEDKNSVRFLLGTTF